MITMDIEGIFSGTITLLEQGLTVRSKKHSVVAANVANIDTPHYKAFDVVVAEEMEKIAGKPAGIGGKRTNAGHLPLGRGQSGIRPKMVENPQSAMRKDDNTVDLDRSMAALSENAILYNALAEIVARKFEGLDQAIDGGR